MRTRVLTSFALAVCIFGSGCLVALGESNPADIDDRATHEQAQLIKVTDDPGEQVSINAFCLSQEGNILAACGDGPGEVRVLDPGGELISRWEVPVKPESINTAPDGTVLVAGTGALLRYSIDGEELQQADSPHAGSMKENAAKIREEVVQQLQQRTNTLATQIEQFEQMIVELEKKKEKEELNKQEERVLAILPKQIELLKSSQQEEPEPAKVSDEQIEQQVQFMTERKMRMASISADDEYVYVATPAQTGHGYAVWRMDHDFQNGEVVVTGLRGCCGQMDVQACSTGIYVAENARHRVVRYSSGGDETAAWGKQDRTGVDGFTSCCNPMNVCFNKEGDVFTAESNTGRIKRFSADGEFKEFVGDVKLVPGCKNVSIAVSDDTERVYMLDITRNHIVLMQRKSAEEQSEPRAAGAE